MNCFKKKNIYESHGETPPGAKPQPESEWGIIIPHTQTAMGARSETNNISEYEYALEMMNHLPNKYETRNNSGVYGAASLLYKQGFRFSLEPHLNAHNGSANGFQIMYLHGDDLSLEAAQNIASVFEKMFPHKIMRYNRGVKKLVKGDRGYYNLVEAKRAGMEIALLSEAFFIDNPKDWIDVKVMAEFWKKAL